MNGLRLAGALAAIRFGGLQALAAELPDLQGRTVKAVTENAYTPLNFADPRPARESAGNTTLSTRSPAA
jgi:polar amino acid transport system substrate-binding protein